MLRFLILLLYVFQHALADGISKRLVVGAECYKLPALNHGSYSCTGNKFRDGQQCHITCDAGYVTNRNTHTITCIGGAQWTPHITCREKLCPALKPQNGQFSCSHTQPNEGSTCVLSCSAGYHLETAVDRTTCGKDGTWSAMPLCIDNSTCPHPPQVSNGLYVCPSKDVFPPGTACPLYCSSKHKIRVSPQITCNAGPTPQWTGLGICAEMHCPEPPSIQNGGYTCSSTNYTSGTTCLLQCNTGFRTVTINTNITCKTDETWTPSTSCIEGCGPGTFSSSYAPGQVSCQNCPQGTYQPGQDSNSCIPCPPGWSTLSAGATAVDECLNLCAIGTYSATGVEPCHLCHVGTYQNSTGATQCTPCPSGESTSTVGATSQSQCIGLP